ncbi:MAG: AAA family ATPase [Oligoflexia bacterium]|nr:AAA family ATPase [Oligoflexia bacterium]
MGDQGQREGVENTDKFADKIDEIRTVTSTDSAHLYKDSNCEKLKIVLDDAKKVVWGQDKLLKSILASIVCNGHLLIEGLPGLGKTLSVSTISKLCDLKFKRIQFTPDLLPADLIGTLIFVPGETDFKVKFGPLFTQILLADEINRAPPKVQSALLEAMEERQITIGDKTYLLDLPFVVLATQNPIEHEGTYPLPEAQVDRFMMKINLSYPDFENEKNIFENCRDVLSNFVPILNVEDLSLITAKVDSIFVDPKIKELIVKIVHATRPGTALFDTNYNKIITMGASPRAGLWLYRLAKFNAFFCGCEFVTPEHIYEIIPDVLGHRIYLSYEAVMEKINSREIATKIAQKIL